jgi:hypothetical protein
VLSKLAPPPVPGLWNGNRLIIPVKTASKKHHTGAKAFHEIIDKKEANRLIKPERTDNDTSGTLIISLPTI